MKSTNCFQYSLAGCFRNTKIAHELAQAHQSSYNAVRYTLPFLKVVDRVGVDREYFTNGYFESGPSLKLIARRFGPFKIPEVIGKMRFVLNSHQTSAGATSSTSRTHHYTFATTTRYICSVPWTCKIHSDEHSDSFI